MRYLESFLICLPCFFILLIFFWILYNMQGVIAENGRYDQFVIKPLADLAKKD